VKYSVSYNYHSERSRLSSLIIDLLLHYSLRPSLLLLVLLLLVDGDDVGGGVI